MPKPTLKQIVDDMRFVQLIAKRSGECAECSTPINRGDKITWDKQFHKAYCESCGEDCTN